MEKDVILTQEGYEKLRRSSSTEDDERREVADRIREAREFGDISENSEYDDAKNEQAMLERRSPSSRSGCAPRASSTPPRPAATWSRRLQVTVKDVERKRDSQYQIVGSAEADPTEGGSRTSRRSAAP